MINALIKYWRIGLPVGLLLLSVTGFNVWVSSEKAQAVTEVIEQIEEATKEQVAIDEQEVYEAYVESGVINDYVDRMLNAPEKDSGSDRLFSTEEDSRATDGDETRVSVGTSDELLPEEVDRLIREAAEILLK